MNAVPPRAPLGGNFQELAGAVVNELLARRRNGGDEVPPPPLLLATTKGDIERQCAWMRETMESASEPLALPTLGTALADLACDRPVTPAYVVSTACTSGLLAIIEAAMQVQYGTTGRAMAVGADVAGDFVRDGFAALKALSPTACRPFDLHRNGLMLGSGAAGCLLSGSPGADIVVSGWGVSNDAVHMTAPDREARGLVRAIHQALDSARLEPRDIDVLFAHGTATPFNDAMEAVAIEKVFPGRSPAVTAVKGLIGHTLGAAGLIEAVLAVEMIRRGTIFPIVGLQQPERPGIDFVREPRTRDIRHILKIGSGFGGMNAAVILSKAKASHSSASSRPATGAAILAAASGAGPDAISELTTRAMTTLLEHIPPEKRPVVGLVLGTTLGCLETDREFERSRLEAGGRYASPAAFSRTLPSTVAAEIALKCGLTGPSLVLSAGDNSAATALRRGIAWIDDFNLDYCIAGGVDWTGERIGLPPGKRAALFLLHRYERGIGQIDAHHQGTTDLRAIEDRSLVALARAIDTKQEVATGGIRVKWNY